MLGTELPARGFIVRCSRAYRPGITDAHYWIPLHERVGAARIVAGTPGSRRSTRRATQGMWSRVIHVDGERDGARSGIYGAGPSYDYELTALQIGLDLYRSDDAGRYGDTAGMRRPAVRKCHAFRYRRCRSWTRSYSWLHDRGYWTRYGTVSRPWYIDAIVQATWYEAQAQSAYGELAGAPSDGMGYALSLEGVPVPPQPVLTLGPQTQVDYSTLALDSSSDLGARVHFDDNDPLVGRLSARLSPRWNRGDDAEQAVQSTGWARIGLLRELGVLRITSFSS